MLGVVLGVLEGGELGVLLGGVVSLDEGGLVSVLVDGTMVVSTGSGGGTCHPALNTIGR